MHTKGNWEIGTSLPDHETEIICRGKRICEVKHYKAFKSDVNYSEGIANARLIAAAPDMLDALQFLENNDNSIPKHAWELVKAAIAKATSVTE
jgi:hypothetical protein